MKENAAVMSGLHSGDVYREERGRWLIAGSQAEGLALEHEWGHPPADTDSMRLIGGRLGVYIPGGQTTREAACLEYHPEGCPPAYCKVEVIDLTALRRALSNYTGSWWEEHIKVRRCTASAGGHHWLHTYNTLRLIRFVGDTVSGPAKQDGLAEKIITLVCSGPHPALEREFRHRSRKQWPPTNIIECILKLPILLVLVGHKLSDDVKYEARISWSHCEIKILQELPENVRQGYIASKYVLKYFLAAHRGQSKTNDGRRRVCSYHVKTAFLYYLEKRPPQMITSPFRLFIDLLNDLDHYLDVGKLPHYFLAESNLLETVDGEERRIARQAIQAILSDPLAALLTSPTDPHQIYGEVRSDALVDSFRRIVTHPTCERSWNDLSLLLARVDEYRRGRYGWQRWLDKECRVSVRPELTELVAALKRIRPCVYQGADKISKHCRSKLCQRKVCKPSIPGILLQMSAYFLGRCTGMPHV